MASSVFCRSHRIRRSNYQASTSSTSAIRSVLSRLLFLSIPSFLSAACLFNCPDNNFSRFLARQIRDGQMRDGLAPAGLFFRIDRNLRDLYCDPWGAPVNDCNLSFLFLSQGTPPKWHFYVTTIKWSTRRSHPLVLVDGPKCHGTFMFNNTKITSNIKIPKQKRL